MFLAPVSPLAQFRVCGVVAVKSAGVAAVPAARLTWIETAPQVPPLRVTLTAPVPALSLAVWLAVTASVPGLSPAPHTTVSAEALSLAATASYWLELTVAVLLMLRSAGATAGASTVIVIGAATVAADNGA